jgi:salicylate hydroxylase
LTLAAAFDQFDKEKCIELHIYEAAPQLEEIGAGLTIWGPTWDLLARIGCQDELAKNAICLSTIDSDSGFGDGFRFKKSDQRQSVIFLNDTVPGMIYGALQP